MGKIRSFLGIFVFLFSVVFATNSFADGYVCDDLKTYTSCNAGYFMDGTTCTKCGTYSSTGENNTATSCKCSDGYTTDAAPAGSSNTTTTTAPCMAIQTTITLDGNGATTAGTPAIYGRYGVSMLFLDSARSQAMTSGNNSLTPPSRVHTVTFNANGGTVTTSSTTATYTFKGYYSAKNDGTQYIDTSGYPTSAAYNAAAALTANATWYAQWTSAVVSLPTPSRTGHTFLGWYNQKTGGDKIGVAGIQYTPTSDITLYAHWEPNEYTITIDKVTASGSLTVAGVTATGTDDVKVTCKYGDEIELPDWDGSTNALTLLHSIFTGWSEDSPVTCDKNKTITPVWQTGKCVAGTGVASALVGINNNILTCAVTCNNGYVHPEGESGTYTADAGVYSLETACIADTYTFRFTVNGGSGGQSDDVTATFGQALPEISTTAPTRAGHTFMGWYTLSDYTNDLAEKYYNANGSAALETVPYLVSGSQHLYAGWKENTYDVTYDCGSGTGDAPTSDTATYNSNYTPKANTCTAPSGYSFGGWTVSGTSVTKTAGTAFKWTYTEDKTFTAKWDVITYSISYTLNGGTNYTGAPASYNVTTATITLGTPTRANSTFLGWYTESSFTNKITQIAKGSIGDKTLYAKWKCNDGWTANAAGTACTANTITLKWANGGRGTAPTTPASCTYGGTFTTPAAMTADGYTFGSWTVNGKTFAANTSVTCNSENLGVTSGTATITGTWSANKFKVTFNVNGADSGTANPTSVECTYGQACTAAAQGTMLKTNHVFGGWYTKSDGTGTNYAAGGSIKNISTGAAVTLYAKWTGCTAATKGTGVASATLSGVTNNVCQYVHVCSTGYYNANHNKTTTSSSITCSECRDLPANAAWTGAATTDSCAWKCNACVKGTNAASCNLDENQAARTCTYTGTCNINTYNPVASGATISCSTCPTNSTADAGNTATSCTCKTGHSVGGTTNGATTTSGTTACLPITYPISYELDGGTNYTGAPATYTYGTGATIAGIPTKSGHVFAGWCTDSAKNSCAYSQTIATTATGTKTFYAKWTTASCSATNGTAKLSEVSGNKVVCSITCNNGFSKDGGADTTQSFDVTGTVNTASVSATCSERTYTVAYDCGDGTGTAPTSNTATYNSNYTPKTNTCTRSGYNFAGWAVSGTTDTKQAGTAFKWTYTADKTFTAKWTSESEKQINYVTDGGTINGSYTAACNVETSTFTLPTNVTKPGYTFKGWYTAATGGTQVTSVVKGTCTSTLTFYAQWTTCNEVTAGACNCTSTQYPLNGTCTNCTYSCSNVTGFTLGTYNVCASQNDTICYRNCTTNDVLNSTSVSGTVTKGGTVSCKATACADDYYISGDGCQSCPENATCGGEAEWSCDKGYKKTDNGLGCEPETYTVTLNANGGTGGTTSVTATYNSLLPAITVPNRTNYNFLGYYDTAAETGGNQYYDAAGKPVKTWTTAGTGTLYARWSLGIFTCTAGQDADGNKCAAGSYCPGGNVSAGTEYSTTSGCERTCPSDILRNGTVSSADGSTSISQCFTTRSNTATPNGTGKGDQRCEYGINAAQTDNYAGACKVTINWCNAGMYRLSNDDTECISTQPGEYSPTGDTAVYYCSDLAGADGTVTSVAGSDEAEDCYNTCSAISIDNGVRNPVNATESYNGTKIPACTYTTKCDEPGYEADGETCVPMVYEITLDHDGGTSSTNTIWLKYNTGWYSNSGATTKITSVTLPTKAGGYTCSGYLSSDGDVVVDESGNLTTNYKVLDANATITANWGQNASITCAAGTYYKGTGTTCTDCPAGSYCEGITTVQDIGSERGRATCSALNGTYTAATDASGAKLTVSISSAEKSTSASACYATNVAYSTTTATGSQTCYYNSGTYNAKCVNKTVFTCIDGYYLAKTTDTDCSVVGKGYYSPKPSLSRSMCPGFGTDSQVTTDSDKSANITACKRGNTAVEISHGWMRARCTHGSDTPSDLTDVSGYKDNCQLGVVVTCDGGYYDDGSYTGTGATPYCVEVGVNNYSPDQETCSGSAEIPLAENPGCSTKISACPAGSTTNGITTASSSSQCDGACPEDMVCEEGKEAISCSDLTGGEYPKSDVGTTDASWCYKPCETACVEPDSCPENFLGCKYSTGEKVSGRWYYGSSSCTVENASCSVDLNNGETYCNSGYYLSAETQNCSTTCSSLEPAGYYRYSISATFANGPKACYDQCTPTCNHAAAYVLDAETGEETGTFVNHCPEHATCTEGKVPTKGYRWYPQEVCTPTSFCSFTFVCDPGYVANTEDSVEYGYTKTLYTAPMTASDVATCTPGTYKVTLDDNGGNGGNGAAYQKYTVGWFNNQAASGAISTVTIPTRTGYTFKGYFDAKSGGHPIIGTDGKLPANTTFTADSTLYAQWSVKVYDIAYNLNGGTNSAANPATYTIEDTPLTLENPSKKGYIFGGWTGDKVSGDQIAEGTTGNVTVTANWTETTFTVHFDPTDAAGVSVPDVTCTYDMQCKAADAIIMDYKTFSVWNTQADGSGQSIAAGGNITNLVSDGGEITLYAIWDQNMVACEAGYYFNNGTRTECKLGQYCPGTGKINEGSTGCIETCPAGGATIKSGATAITQCRKITVEGDIKFEYGTALWDCAYTSGTGDSAVYRTDCNAIALSCDAGYYYTGNGAIACTPVPDGYYSPAPEKADGAEYPETMKSHACPGETGADDGIGSVQPRAAMTNCYSACALTTSDITNSKTVTADEERMFSTTSGDYPACSYTITCNPGYTPQNGTDPKCIANKYTIVLDKNQGTGNVVDSVTCEFNSGKCDLPATSALTRAGYVAAGKWCTNADGTGTCYTAGASTDKNISATGENTKLYAAWDADVLKITLVASDATSNATQDPVYLKYTIGWYSDEAAKTPISSIETANLPSKPGYNFAGYKIGDVTIVDASGKLQTTAAVLTVTTKDTSANVVWAQGNTDCEAGYYYPGTGGSCVVCEADHYCPGGSFPTDAGLAGHEVCPDDGISEGGESATNVGVCYKQGLDYTSATGKASGTQTCNYNDTDKKYNKSCRDRSVKSCVAGYYYVSGTDCTEVGKDHYSGEGSLTREVCPENGTTGSLTTAAEVGECYKTVDYVATYGTGTQVCNYTSQNDDGSAKYATNCRDKYITACQGGYYRENADAIDCVKVGYDAYSEEGSLNKTPCPDGGDTDSETSATSTMCYKSENPFTSDHGSGVRYCRYTPETGDYTVCGDRMFQNCSAGYYWAAYGDADCVPVDYGFFGPVADVGNEGYLTARQECATYNGQRGQTDNPTSADASACFMSDIPCEAGSGTGTKVCGYDTSAENYTADCTTCAVDSCANGYYLSNNQCIQCPEGSICDENTGKDTDGDGIPDAQPKVCADLFNGRYPNSDKGATSTDQCWGACDASGNVETMSGRDYAGENIADTCEIASCKPQYYLSSDATECVLCPEGMICEPGSGEDLDGDGKPDNGPKSCKDLTNGTHPFAEPGSTKIEQCYITCEDYEIEYGMAIRDSDKAYYDNVCTYKGVSDTGNPCEIRTVNGVETCVETSCKPEYELINGRCQECDRENATAYKPNGNCLVAKCHTGYHPDGDQCADNVQTCSAPNAIAATRTWDTKIGAYGICVITECADGYHIASNACVPDVQECDVEHGSGVQEWDSRRGTWGDCIATSCDAGYTNDKYETDEPGKQCGRCRNAYSILGEVAVSSYVRGCEIAACLYQGELYNLENNECVPICPINEYTDPEGTGTMKWNPDTKKCERKCNEGYIPW